MKVNVRVIPKSSKNDVRYFEDRKLLKVWTTAAPEAGKANGKVVELIAEYLGVNKKFVQVSTGTSSQNKIIEISTEITIEDLTKKPKLFDC